jgi:hypothetical protein
LERVPPFALVEEPSWDRLIRVWRQESPRPIVAEGGRDSKQFGAGSHARNADDERSLPRANVFQDCCGVQYGRLLGGGLTRAADSGRWLAPDIAAFLVLTSLDEANNVSLRIAQPGDGELRSGNRGRWECHGGPHVCRALDVGMQVIDLDVQKHAPIRCGIRRADSATDATLGLTVQEQRSLAQKEDPSLKARDV